ncbi:MAG: excalibur calcium-binding domain-containing protein [Lysobacter sp.]|nr:MAG: excalibur calcium-binding domain-containing protein [Lysobacter sp.]
MRNAERPTPVATPRTASASTRHTRRPRQTDRHRRADERSSGRIGGLVVLLAAVAAGAAIVRRDAIETYLPSSPVSTSVSTSASAMPGAAVPAAEMPAAERPATTMDVAPAAPTAFVSAAPAPAASSFSDAAVGGFRCDGRTHCSQMTSCAEARYFLANCPGAQMDGNGDGDPCEQQWCH